MWLSTIHFNSKLKAQWVSTGQRSKGHQYTANKHWCGRSTVEVHILVLPSYLEVHFTVNSRCNKTHQLTILQSIIDKFTKIWRLLESLEWHCPFSCIPGYSILVTYNIFDFLVQKYPNYASDLCHHKCQNVTDFILPILGQPHMRALDLLSLSDNLQMTFQQRQNLGQKQTKITSAARLWYYLTISLLGFNDGSYCNKRRL